MAILLHIDRQKKPASIFVSLRVFFPDVIMHFFLCFCNIRDANSSYFSLLMEYL